MKKRKSIGLCVGICLLLLGILDVVNVFAAVTEGKAGEMSRKDLEFEEE